VRYFQKSPRKSIDFLHAELKKIVPAANPILEYDFNSGLIRHSGSNFE
jgi:hypothetical protein